MLQRLEISVNDHGDIIIPAVFRNILGLKSGTRLIVEDTRNQDIRLRIERDTPELIDKQGILVVRAEATEDIQNFVDTEGERRLNELLHRIVP